MQPVSLEREECLNKCAGEQFKTECQSKTIKAGLALKQCSSFLFSFTSRSDFFQFLRDRNISEDERTLRKTEIQSRKQNLASLACIPCEARTQTRHVARKLLNHFKRGNEISGRGHGEAAVSIFILDTMI